MQETQSSAPRGASDKPRHDPESSARGWLARGCEQEHVQDWEGAVASYGNALAEDPQDPVVCYFANNNLGYSLNQLGRFDEAEGYCEAAVAINPVQYNAHKNLGLAREGQGRWLDAAYSLAEAARLCPQNARAWLHLRQLLTFKPGLLAQAPDLAGDVAALETVYRASGAVPQLN
jgi:tetratricopeptide (TPR) repeat protein